MMTAINQLGDAERIAALNSGTLIKGAKHKMLSAGAVLSPVELELQAATLARNWAAMFTKDGVPYSWPKKAPLGKYSFREGPGGRVYVPFTFAEIDSFGRSQFAKIKKCKPKRLRQVIKKRSTYADKTAAKFPPTDPRHVRHIFPGQLFCKKKSDSLLKKVAIGAAVVTGAVFLGPQVLSVAKGIGGAAISAGGKLVGIAAKALPLAEKVINGKAMTEAIKNGEMPPPPISLGDGTLTDYAQVIGQQMLERDLARQATEAEKAELAWLIEQQRLMMAQQERPHFPVVNTGLAPEVTAAQKERADNAVGTNNILKMLAIAVPVGLVIWKGV